MRRIGKTWLAVLLVAITPQVLRAQAVRLVNGAAVQGEVVGIGEEGLQVRTATGMRTFTWDTLAPNTRFRYQPLYRANYDAVLQGIPRARWTNAPDPQLEAELRVLVQSATTTTSAAPAPKPAAAPSPAESLLIFEGLKFTDAAPLQASAFPNATFRDFERSSFVGFQYGSTATDVVYFAFDSPGPDELSDIAFVYSPGAEEFKSTVKFKGFKKGSGADRRVTFRKFRAQTNLGNTLAILEFEPEIASPTPGSMFLTVSISLSRDRQTSRFTLTREFTDLLTGDGVVPVKGVWDYPNLWIGCTPQPDGAAKATLLLTMGNMILVPRDGMESRVSLSVADNAGNIVFRDTVKMDIFPPPLDGVVAELKRVTAGQTYKVSGRIHLGPFLGPAEATDTLTMPSK